MTTEEAEGHVGKTVFSKKQYEYNGVTIKKLSPWILEAYTGGTQGTFLHPDSGRCQEFQIVDFLTPEAAKFYPR
jgi:hypothetical protein